MSLTPMEKGSLIATVALLILLIVMAALSWQHASVLGLAVSVGGLGGLVHEFAQSGGKMLFFQKQADGLYLGAVAGIVLGAVAGVLVVRGHLLESPAPAQGTANVGLVQLAYEVFVAGLALKGVVEAAGGTPVPATPGGGR